MMMDSIIFVVLRRLRQPLILLISCYAISVLGLTLMPGTDDQGNPWQLSLSQAFYVISYTATTIGFGELPYTFSTAQRLWMLFSIYLTVIIWFYAIGRIIALLQEPGLKRSLVISRFTHSVRKLREPFYIICGYGDTGATLIEALDRMGLLAVVIDIDEMTLNELELRSYHADIPSLCADAGLPETLSVAGLNHRYCRGIIALANDDQANLAVAVTSKLINPRLPVLCRAEHTITAENLQSFGTDFIINPYTAFGHHLAMAVHDIGNYNLQEWLTGVPGESYIEHSPPPRGHWIVCGYGRFGKSVIANLQEEGITTTIVEADPELTGCDDCIIGSGAEASTLIKANIDQAVGIVAGTDDDYRNLAIAMTARKLNSDVFIVARKNRRHNSLLFRQFNANLTMQSGQIIAHECLGHLISPLLATFLARSQRQSEDWAEQTYRMLTREIGMNQPETWEITIGREQTPAIHRALQQGKVITLGDLLRDPSNRDESLPCQALLHIHDQRKRLLPKKRLPLSEGDRLLFCGQSQALAEQRLCLHNDKVLVYLNTGEDIPDSAIWRYFKQRARAANEKKPPVGQA